MRGGENNRGGKAKKGGRVNRRKNVRHIQKEGNRKRWHTLRSKKVTKYGFNRKQHPQEFGKEHHQIIMKQGTDVGCNNMEESEFSRDEKATKAEV